MTRRRPRFSTMEVLGFTETPAAVHEARLTWVETEVATAPVDPKPDFFSSWFPSDFGGLGRRVRWGLMVTIVALVCLVAVAAYWVYRRPVVEAARARDDVAVAIAELTPAVVSLREVTATLAADEIDTTAATTASLSVDTGVRTMFEAVARLSDEDDPIRNRLIALSGQVAEATRQFNDALAVRSAVLPALIPPALPVGADVDLEEAASTFADWQARYESIREALPETTFREVSQAMAALSANLPGHQRLYLDALAGQDEATAAGVVTRITTDLEGIRELLMASLTTTREQVTEALETAETGLAEVAGLLG